MNRGVETTYFRHVFWLLWSPRSEQTRIHGSSLSAVKCQTLTFSLGVKDSILCMSVCLCVNCWIKEMYGARTVKGFGTFCGSSFGQQHEFPLTANEEVCYILTESRCTKMFVSDTEKLLLLKNNSTSASNFFKGSFLLSLSLNCVSLM